MRVDDDESQKKTIQKSHETIRELQPTNQQVEDLQFKLEDVKCYSRDQLEELKDNARDLVTWLYGILDMEKDLERRVEKVTHELQTRVQPLLAHAEVLYIDLHGDHRLDPDCVHTLSEVLNNTLALHTVIRNLGDFEEEYRFEERAIASLLYEAKRIYEAEADRRRVDINIRVGSVDGQSPVLELSKVHMQLAFNNLMHNAVKYSFRGAPGRERYVRIVAHPAGDYYRILFENYGVGILPHEIEEGLIFQDGYQGELTQEEYRTGSGKGLHFADQVITKHHGRIEVSSIPQGDSKEVTKGEPCLNQFAIYLPYEHPK
jgi:signal transduction histidine kinase